MILICQNLRNNLQHPNEFLRGVTLRFLCRITEQARKGLGFRV
jgi:coatomer subunit beta